MGNKAIVCRDCNKQEYCQKCFGCSRCNPVKDCLVCLRQNPKNITIRIQYQEFKRIYNQGTITKIQGKASQGASKVPFVGKNLHHFFIQVQVYHKKTQSTVICAVEGSMRSRRMEMSISRPHIDIRKAFKAYMITNKPFRDLFDHIIQKEHEQKYQCFGNNCYHVGLRLIQHLYPEFPKADYQQIVEYKDKVISGIWD